MVRPRSTDDRAAPPRRRGSRVPSQIVWRLTLLLSLLVLHASCTFPGSVKPTLKIGLVAPFEGRYRYVGYDVIYAVRLALQEVNEAGGVAGYGVELVAYDDGGTAEMAVDQARKLWVDPDVVGVVGHFRQSTTSAALDTYARVGLPLVAPTAMDPDLGSREAVLTLAPTADRVARVLIDRAAGLASDGDVLLVTDGGALGEAVQEAAREQETWPPGMRLDVVSVVEPGWQQEVLARYPEVVLCDLNPVPAGELATVLGEGAWPGDVLGGPQLAATDFVAVAGTAAAGARFVTPWPFPHDVPGGGAFAAAYRSASDGTEAGPLALPAYEGTWLLLQALEEAARQGDPSRAGVAASLSGVQRQGLLGRLPAGRGDGSFDGVLYWYHIGPDGVPIMGDNEGSGGRMPRARRVLPGAVASSTAS